MLIAPHITLVYPFDSAAAMSALHDHVRRVAQRSRAFVASCIGVSMVEDEYVFLNIVAGADELARMHRALYRDELQAFAPARYVPHITLARTTDRTLLERAFESASAKNFDFTVVVSSISVYWIDPDLPRRAVFEVALADAR